MVSFGQKNVKKVLYSNYEVHKGNPADDTLLMHAVDRHDEKTSGYLPDAVTTDRGYSFRGNEENEKPQIIGMKL